MARIGLAEEAAVAMTSARAGRVASLRIPPATATVPRSLTRDDAAAVVSPRVVRVSFDDMPYEPLVLTVDLARDALDAPRKAGDRMAGPVERQARRTAAPRTTPAPHSPPAPPSTPAKVAADVPAEPVARLRGETEAP
jgi:hypothetical protein